MQQSVAASAFQFDLFVLGAGSGGVRASRIAARHGARVAICEESRVGGTCVIRGCIPKKILWYSSHFSHHFHDANNYGWTSNTSFDWPTLLRNKNTEIDRLNSIYKNLLSGSGVQLIEGHGKIIDPHTVQVGENKFTAKNLLIATGSWPYLPSIPGIEYAVTSNEVLEFEQMPKRIVVVGGGYIACEFAGIFNGCGSQVTQIYRGDMVLRGFDNDMRSSLSEEISGQGINLLLKTNVTKIEKRDNGELVCHLDNGEPIVADVVCYATGRTPNIKNLGLEAVGVKLKENGAVVVDEWSRTNIPSIYAVGDVTDRINLTPVALAEGHAFADTVFGGNPRIFVHHDVPCAVFSQPPLSCVGLTEAEATKQFGEDIDVYISRFTPLKHTISKRKTKSVMKLVVQNSTQRVLGCHMLGDDAPEIIQGLAIAITCKATKQDFDRTIGIHPSAAEEFVTMRTKRE